MTFNTGTVNFLTCPPRSADLACDRLKRVRLRHTAPARPPTQPGCPAETATIHTLFCTAWGGVVIRRLFKQGLPPFVQLFLQMATVLADGLRHQLLHWKIELSVQRLQAFDHRLR